MVSRTFLIFLPCPGGGHATIFDGATLSILLHLRLNLDQYGQVNVSFLLHYFLAPAEHFLPKELSQIFAPIPGGGHATSRGVQSSLRMEL
jgi:hypothetical protein